MKITKAQLKREIDNARANGLYAHLEIAASMSDLPLAFLLAIASRETAIRNISGDGGHGRGVMQVDDRYHHIARVTDFKGHPEVLIRYGCRMLADNIAWARRFRPGFKPEQHLKMAAAAYNCGRGGVIKALPTGDCDARTTGKDYGADVLKRMALATEILTA